MMVYGLWERARFFIALLLLCSTEFYSWTKFGLFQPLHILPKNVVQKIVEKAKFLTIICFSGQNYSLLTEFWYQSKLRKKSWFGRRLPSWQKWPFLLSAMGYSYFFTCYDRPLILAKWFQCSTDNLRSNFRKLTKPQSTFVWLANGLMGFSRRRDNIIVSECLRSALDLPADPLLRTALYYMLLTYDHGTWPIRPNSLSARMSRFIN